MNSILNCPKIFLDMAAFAYHNIGINLTPQESTIVNRFKSVGTTVYTWLPNRFLSLINNKYTPYTTTVLYGVQALISVYNMKPESHKINNDNRWFMRNIVSTRKTCKNGKLMDVNDYYGVIGRVGQAISHSLYFIEKLYTMNILKTRYFASVMPYKNMVGGIGLLCSIYSQLKEWNAYDAHGRIHGNSRIHEDNGLAREERNVLAGMETSRRNEELLPQEPTESNHLKKFAVALVIGGTLALIAMTVKRQTGFIFKPQPSSPV